MADRLTSLADTATGIASAILQHKAGARTSGLRSRRLQHGIPPRSHSRSGQPPALSQLPSQGPCAKTHARPEAFLRQGVDLRVRHGKAQRDRAASIAVGACGGGAASSSDSQRTSGNAGAALLTSVSERRRHWEDCSNGSCRDGSERAGEPPGTERTSGVQETGAGSEEFPPPRLRLLLIDNYDSYTYNLAHLLTQANGEPPTVILNDSLTWSQLKTLLVGPGETATVAAEVPPTHSSSSSSSSSSSVSPGSPPAPLFDAVIISPGPGTPTCPSDIGVSWPLLSDPACARVPILGVCLGHQALAAVHGGDVVRAAEPVHGRLSGVDHTGHPLFRNIPSGAPFQVMRYHSLVVAPPSLPACLEAIAWTTPAPASACLAAQPSAPQEQPPAAAAPAPPAAPAAVLMAAAHRHRPHFGVQFHPESVASAFGLQLASNFLRLAAQHRRQGSALPAQDNTAGSRGAGTQAHPLWLSAAVNAARIGRLGVTATPLPPAHGAPSAAAAEEKAGERRRRPVGLRLHMRRLKGALPRIRGGSAAVFSALFAAAPAEGGAGAAAAHADTFWLDSACSNEGRARFSHMGGRGGPLWRRLMYRQQQGEREEGAQAPAAIARSGQQQGGPSWADLGVGGPTAQAIGGSELLGGVGGDRGGGGGGGGGELHITDSKGNGAVRRLPGGLFEFLEEEMAAFHLPPAQWRHLPFDFCGGLVGVLGYELKSECLPGLPALPCPPSPAARPSACLFRVDRWLTLDHLTGDVHICAVSATGGGGHGVGGQKLGGVGGESGRSNNGSAVCSESREEAAVEDAAAAAEGWVEAKAWRLEALMAAEAACRLQGTADTCQPGQPAETLPAVPHSGRAEEEGLGPGAVGHAGSRQPSTGQRMPWQVAGRLEGVWGPAEYGAAVRACQEAIAAGEAYELCLTQQLRARGAPEDPLAAYLRLRERSPAPYAAWMHFEGWGARQGEEQAAKSSGTGNAGAEGDDALSRRSNGETRSGAESSGRLGRGAVGRASSSRSRGGRVVVCCCSPERLLRGDREGAMEAKPIKGTRARGRTPEEDTALRAELQNSEKDRAENLMIVDLLRNDLARVSLPASVRVPHLLAVESFSAVHQLVSTVQSQRLPGVSPAAALRSVFPPGSMTGAPKVRACALLQEVEAPVGPRGLYSGALGFLSFAAPAFDFNVVIRTAVVWEGEGGEEETQVGAGGAVVVQSDPQQEYEEMRLKARALREVLEPGGRGE